MYIKNITLQYFHTYSCKSLKYNFHVKQHFVRVYVYLVHADKLIEPNNTTHKTAAHCQMLRRNCFNTVSTYSRVHRKKRFKIVNEHFYHNFTLVILRGTSFRLFFFCYIKHTSNQTNKQSLKNSE